MAGVPVKTHTVYVISETSPGPSGQNWGRVVPQNEVKEQTNITQRKNLHKPACVPDVYTVTVWIWRPKEMYAGSGGVPMGAGPYAEARLVWEST